RAVGRHGVAPHNADASRRAVPDPHGPRPRLAQRENCVRCQPVLEPMQRQPLPRPDDEVPVAVLTDRDDALARQAALGPEGRELATVHAEQAAIAGADPEDALGVLEQGLAGVALEARDLLAVEDDELDAAEADEPLVGAEPEVAVPGLRGGEDRILR